MFVPPKPKGGLLMSWIDVLVLAYKYQPFSTEESDALHASLSIYVAFRWTTSTATTARIGCGKPEPLWNERMFALSA